MRGKKMQIMLLVVMIFALLTSTGCYRKAPEQRAQGIVNDLADKLNLNDAQKARLNTMKDQYLAKVPAMKKTREETFDEMISLMRSPTIDEGKINSLVQQNRAQADDLIGFIFTRFREFHDMLTPEQKEKAAKEMERWRQQYREYNKENGQK